MGARKAAEGGVCLERSTPLLSDQIFFAVFPRYSENSISNRNLGRKPKQFAVWKAGLTRLPGVEGRWSSEPVWMGKDFHMSVWYGNYREGISLSIYLLNPSTSCTLSRPGPDEVLFFFHVTFMFINPSMEESLSTLFFFRSR